MMQKVVSNGLDYLAKVEQAILATANILADDLANDARRNAPWQDNTGRARREIFGEAELDAARHIVTLYLSHGVSVDYGLELETGHGGRYQTIWPTVARNLPAIKAALQEVLR